MIERWWRELHESLEQEKLSYLKERGYYNPDVEGDRFVKYNYCFILIYMSLLKFFLLYIAIFVSDFYWHIFLLQSFIENLTFSRIRFGTLIAFGSKKTPTCQMAFQIIYLNFLKNMIWFRILL